MEGGLQIPNTISHPKSMPLLQGVKHLIQKRIGRLTGNKRLMTLKLSKHALICVTVLLYICLLFSYSKAIGRMLRHLFTESKSAEQKAHAENE